MKVAFFLFEYSKENKFESSIESSRKRSGLYYKVCQICCFFVEKNVPHLVFVYPGARKKEREEKKKHLEKKAFAQKTKFMSLVEFERKWNESVKLSESRDVMTRSVSSRVSLSGSGCCALPELNLGRLTEWSGIDTSGYFVISSPLLQVVPRSLRAWMKITRRAVSCEKRGA